MEKLQLMFDGNYQTKHKIGRGKSSVYLGVSRKHDNKEVAIKLQSLQDGNSVEYQAKVYKMLLGVVGVPALYWFGKDQNYFAMVIDVLGPSLADLLKYCEGKFSLKTVLMFAQQAIQRLQSIHDKGFVYRDVMPSNFLIGTGSKTDKIYVVDFELSEKFLDIEGNHLMLGPSQSQNSKGVVFLSIHGHLRVKQSRRDDLESLGYMVVYFLKGELPWGEIAHQNKEVQNQLIKEAKVSCPVEILCKGLPIQFGAYFNYVRALEYEQEPDYQWIQRLFKDLFQQSGYQYNLIFDWAQNYHNKQTNQ